MKKEHYCQHSAFFATNVASQVRNCAGYLRSEISSRALATFHNITKRRKQEVI